jgi:hypothetical protein
MNGLFRHHNPRITDCAAVVAFAVACLATVAVVIFPGVFVGTAEDPSPQVSHGLLD